MNEKAVSRIKKGLKVLGCILTVAAVLALISEYKIITDAFNNINGRGLALWIWGFWVSLLLGHFGTKAAMWFFRFYIPKENKKNDPVYLPSWMLGTTERFIFTLLIAAMDPGGGVVAAMTGYVSIKMAAGWIKVFKSADANEDLNKWKAKAYGSLLGNLVSMSFAVLGGSICNID